MRSPTFVLNRKHPLANGLKLAWLSNRYSDHGLYAIRGTTYGETAKSFSPELRRDCQVYDGTGDYISLSAPKSYFSFIQNTNVFTISSWIKVTVAYQRGTILGNCAVSSSKGFLFLYENIDPIFKTIRFISYKGSSGNYTMILNGTINQIVDTGWHHAMVSGYFYGSPQGCLYIDGILRSAGPIISSTLSSGDSTNNISIGGVDTTLPFFGSIADVLCWDRTLSANDAWILSRRDPTIAGLIQPDRERYYPYVESRPAGIRHRIIADGFYGGSVCI